jgi:hypothetical protein
MAVDDGPQVIDAEKKREVSEIVSRAIQGKVSDLADERVRQVNEILGLFDRDDNGRKRVWTEKSAEHVVNFAAAINEHAEALEKRLSQLPKYQNRWRFPGRGAVNHSGLRHDLRRFWNELAEAADADAVEKTPKPKVSEACTHVFGESFTECEGIQEELSSLYRGRSTSAMASDIIQGTCRLLARQHRHSETSVSSVVKFVLGLVALLYVLDVARGHLSRTGSLKILKQLPNMEFLKFWKKTAIVDRALSGAAAGKDTELSKSEGPDAMTLAIQKLREDINEELHEKISIEAEKKIQKGRWRERGIIMSLVTIFTLGVHAFQMHLAQKKTSEVLQSLSELLAPQG